MNWVAPVSTLLGAVIGIASTLFADRARFRRDRNRELEDTRRRIYAKYLEALVNVDSEIQLLASSRPTPVDVAVLRDTWRRHSLLALRYEVSMIAPERVVDAADYAYRALRAMRNLVGRAGVRIGHPAAPDGDGGWDEVHQSYVNALEQLRSVMRSDIRQGVE